MKLGDRWRSLCKDLGLDGTKAWETIQRSYREHSRLYHNLEHIENCLNLYDQHRSSAINPVALEFAVWFHDLVYDTRASDNEKQSAEAASAFLKGTEIAEPVAKLILATQHDHPLLTADEKLMCDIDLSILGSNPTRYQTYANAIRQEYRWVHQRDYAAGRSKVLKQFINREHIYHLDVFRELLEEKARANLSRELTRLEDQQEAS